MLAIEEQIERIADHALERASVPVRAPRRWPAMAAAAVMLLAAGSVVWAVSSRDGDAGSAIAPGPVSTSPGTESALPLADIESVVVEPLEDPRVQPSSGTIRVTFGDAPVLVGMPVVNDSGLVGKVLSVDNGIASVQLVTADGFSIGAAAEVEGENRRTGVVLGTGEPALVTFSRVEDSDDQTEIAMGTIVVTAGGAQSISPAGIPIGRIVSSSSPSDPGSRSSAIDPLWDDVPDSALRVLLFIPDATAGASTAADAPAEEALPPDAAAEPIVLPTELPGDWRVFATSRTSSIVSPSADQVFGRYEQNGLVGLRATVTANEFLGVGEGAELIELRGHEAGIFEDAVGWHVQWSEEGVLVDVTSTGLARETLLAALEQLVTRADAITGFEPGSAPAELPLLSEAITNETTPQVMTGLRLSEGEAPPRPTEGGGVGVFDRTITIFISDRSGLFGSAPEIVFGGERRGDLVVAPDPAGGSGLAAVLADGTIVVIRLPEGIESDVAEVILQSLAPQPPSAFVALQDEASALLAQLPEVLAAPIDDQHTLRLRGGTADAPEAMCLDIDGIERCKLALVASPIGDPSWVNGVLIDGRWYLFGFEPAEKGWLTIAPWRAGETLDALPSIGSVVEGVHFWLSEIPTDIDDVRVLDLASVEGRETTFRRPDR